MISKAWRGHANKVGSRMRTCRADPEARKDFRVHSVEKHGFPEARG